MSSLLKYQKKGQLAFLKRKVQLRNFRTSMGNLEKQAEIEDKKELEVDLKNWMSNPQEIYSKENVKELNKNLLNVGNLEREYIDDVGLNQTVKDAPTDDISSIKKANAKALEYDNKLNPDPALIAAQSTAKSLADRSYSRKMDAVNRMRRRRN